MTPCISTTSSLASAPPAPTPSTAITPIASLSLLLEERRAACSPSTEDGWVTFSRARIPGIGLVFVQKRDGCTRSVVAGR